MEKGSNQNIRTSDTDLDFAKFDAALSVRYYPHIKSIKAGIIACNVLQNQATVFRACFMFQLWIYQKTG